MTEHGRDPDEELQRSANQLEQDLERLEGRLDDAKDHLKDRAEDAQGPGDDPEGAEES